MTKLETVKLPFWQVVVRSFLYVIKNYKTYLKLSSLWFLLAVYEILTGFPLLYKSVMSEADYSAVGNVSTLLLALASVVIAVDYYRAIILGENLKPFSFSFGKRNLLFILYSLLYFMILLIPSFIIIFVAVFILKLANVQSANVLYFTAVMVPLIVAIVSSKMFLAFPAIAVDNAKIRFATSFKMMKGNANKIFFGQILVAVPTTLLVFLISEMQLLWGNAVWVNVLLTVLLLATSFFDVCVKASYFAHIYQYVLFVHKK